MAACAKSHSREGYKTRSYCQRCNVALCRKPRFTKKGKQTYIDSEQVLTCWELYHMFKTLEPPHCKEENVLCNGEGKENVIIPQQKSNHKKRNSVSSVPSADSVDTRSVNLLKKTKVRSQTPPPTQFVPSRVLRERN